MKAAVLFFIGSLFIAQAVVAQTVTVSCSNWPPFFHNEDGAVKGSAFDIAVAVMKEADVDAEFVIHPWKRVYHQGLKNENFMIACLGRTPPREKLFHWIGAIAKGNKYDFYGLKTRGFNINSIDDLKKYKVGVTRGAHSEDFLKEHQFGKAISPVTKSEQLLKMLAIGRFDVIITNKKNLEVRSKVDDIELSKVEKIFKGYVVETNLAFGKNTSDEMVKKTRDAYQRLRSMGKLKID